MKQHYLSAQHFVTSCFIAFLMAGTMTAQVGIGTTNPSVTLDVSATDLTGTTAEGIIAPRLTGDQIKAKDSQYLTAQTGAIVYATVAVTATPAGKTFNITTPGYYYFNGTIWNQLQIKGGERNIYNSDGAITRDRIFNLNGLGNATGSALVFKNRDTDIFKFPSSGRLEMATYGQGNFATGAETQILSVDAQGNVIEVPVGNVLNKEDRDWYKSGTEQLAPTSIGDDIYTEGQVGIGTNAPSASLHIVETGNGTPASNADGTLLIEHANSGGQSSIVFKSRRDNSDYGYINFNDNGSGNGSSTENSLLTIGIENDGVGNNQDDINIAPSGNLGISTVSPQKKLDLNVTGNNNGLRITNTNFFTELLSDNANRSFEFNNSAAAGQYELQFGGATKFTFLNNQFLPQRNASDSRGALADATVTDIGGFDSQFSRVYTRAIHTNNTASGGSGDGLRINIGQGGGANSDYFFTDDDFRPFGNLKNLGNAANQWNEVFVNNQIVNNNDTAISIRIGPNPDYRFLSTAFIPLNSQMRDLGTNANRWKDLWAQRVIATTFANPSDERLKDNISNLELGSSIISKINTYSYSFKDDNKKQLHYGVIAQELQEILPALVNEGDDEMKTLSVNYTELIPILINAIKEQQNIIDSQDSKIDDLASSVAEIKAILSNRSNSQESTSNEKALTAK